MCRAVDCDPSVRFTDAISGPAFVYMAPQWTDALKTFANISIYLTLAWNSDRDSATFRYISTVDVYSSASQIERPSACVR